METRKYALSSSTAWCGIQKETVDTCIYRDFAAEWKLVLKGNENE